jgi:hypothetical protein
MLRVIAPIFLTLVLAGCASPQVWLLADGRLPSRDPVLNQQLEMDKTVCRGRAQAANVSGVMVNNSLAGAVARANAVGQVGEGCMAEKGYVLVPEDQVPQKSEELAQIAAMKANAQKTAEVRR